MQRWSLTFITVLMAGTLSLWSSQEPVTLDELKLSQLESRLIEIDTELAKLAKISLRSGVGSIGYRSKVHSDSENTEWIEIELEQEVPIDEIVLVPALWRDSKKGFQSDGFPESLRIIAKNSQYPSGIAIAEYDSTSKFLPRIAPLIIPVTGIKTSILRIETSRLSVRELDQVYSLQFSEILVFSGEKNIALRRAVNTTDTDQRKRPEVPWARQFLVDGHVPYLMDAAVGEKSLAYINPFRTPPIITLDLEASYPVSRIHLHAVDQSDTVPQAHPGDLGIPRHLKIEGANLPDFSDAVTMLLKNSEDIHETGPIMMWNIPETFCRYIRIMEIDPPDSFRIGFAEIELFSNDQNVALGRVDK